MSGRRGGLGRLGLGGCGGVGPVADEVVVQVAGLVGEVVALGLQAGDEGVEAVSGSGHGGSPWRGCGGAMREGLR